MRATLPSDAKEDAVFTLSGGPLPLSLLGVKEGALGIIDVERGTFSGKARIVLTGEAQQQPSTSISASKASASIRRSSPVIRFATYRRRSLLGELSRMRVRPDSMISNCW